MKADVSRLELNLAYTFRDRSLAELSLTHRSAEPLHNERLELLGDAVLGLIVTELLYQRYPDAPEGLLSKTRDSMINREILAEVARELELGNLLVLGPGEVKSGGRQRPSLLSNAFEAILGAIYLDAGLEQCRSLVLRVLKSRLPDTNLSFAQKDAKSRLQEYLQARGCDVPVYSVIGSSGEEHAKTFTVSCSLSLLKQATQGSGGSRRVAEQQAALTALEQLDKLNSQDT